MYLPNQIVFGLETSEPVKVDADFWKRGPLQKGERTIEFYSTKDDIPPEFGKVGGRWGIFFPSSVEKAREALALGLIKPGN